MTHQHGALGRLRRPFANRLREPVVVLTAIVVVANVARVAIGDDADTDVVARPTHDSVDATADDPCAHVALTTIGGEPPVVASDARCDIDRQAFDALRERGAFVVHPLNSNLVSRLDRGFAVAIDHVDRYPSCRGLFAALGADAIGTLRGTVYLSARLEDLRRICLGRRAAYTYVGRPHTRLCPAFAYLSDNQAAIIVLHEALHFAGLQEAPVVPRAMNSAEINHMIAVHCGL